jgi:8-oxo-dGTP diphosphatase
MSDHKLIGCVLIILKDANKRFALLKRSLASSFGQGKYSIPGGHVEKGETFRNAIIREAFEELGVIVQEDNLRFVHSFYRNTGGQDRVIHVFECTQWNGDVHNKEPDKHTDLLWCTESDLPENIVPHHKNVLGLVHTGIFYSEQTGV